MVITVVRHSCHRAPGTKSPRLCHGSKAGTKPFTVWINQGRRRLPKASRSLLLVSMIGFRNCCMARLPGRCQNRPTSPSLLYIPRTSPSAPHCFWTRNAPKKAPAPESINGIAAKTSQQAQKKGVSNTWATAHSTYAPPRPRGAPRFVIVAAQRQALEWDRFDGMP